MAKRHKAHWSGHPVLESRIGLMRWPGVGGAVRVGEGKQVPPWRCRAVRGPPGRNWSGYAVEWLCGSPRAVLRPFLSSVVIQVMTSTSSSDRIADTSADTTDDLDVAVVEEFGGRLIDIINDACIGLLVSIGHQTGLFETLAELPPATSTQIADAGGLNERYVREWLGGMTTAKIVVRDPVTATYRLPREHAASLTRAAGPDNLARLAQYIAVLGDVEHQIVGCFRNSGGVPYSAYPRFHQIMAEESAGVFDAVLVDGILPLLDRLPDRLRAGIDVADIGCGRGHAINLMAQAFPAAASPATTSPPRQSITLAARPHSSGCPTRRSSARM
jgi:hypothetical protein